MANRVDIDIYANDKTGGTLNNIEGKFSDLEGGFQALTGISLTTAGVIAAIGGGISAAVDYTKDAIEETVKYGDQVATLSRITGTSLEDTSRLIQVAQNMGIEYKDLATGLGNATKKGVDVSIENLLLLADEYKELETPIARAQWLTENFGAAGRDLEPIFAAATESIVADMEEVSDAMVWDAEKQESVDAYKQGMAEVKSAFEEVKIEVGTNFLPVIQTVLNLMNDKEGWRSEGYKRMLGDVKTESWAAIGVLKELWGWLQLIATGPSGGKPVSAAALGIGGVAPEARAVGGAVAPNVPYLVGENGPEIFKPNAAGSIIPNGQISGYGRLMDLTGDVIQEARAVGGAVAPNVPYLVGENGPEIFKPNAAGTIIPNGQISDYSGGGEVDYDRMARAFIEALERSSLVR